MRCSSTDGKNALQVGPGGRRRGRGSVQLTDASRGVAGLGGMGSGKGGMAVCGLGLDAGMPVG